MGCFGLKFHHLGLAVRSPELARSFIEGQGYHIGDTVFDFRQNVNLILCEHENEPPIEIIYPADAKGPLEGLLGRHENGIIYHACYISDDLGKTLASLEEAQLRPVCVSSPKPAVLFGGAKVSFYNVIGMGLIEIIEGPIRAVR